ncbi:hypothetical protein AGMMS50262_18540 [Bacteroidia bacterium]|nr:hypothetical protein AGMMS50262_18540 [Bacteroidia bacterium]
MRIIQIVLSNVNKKLDMFILNISNRLYFLDGKIGKINGIVLKIINIHKSTYPNDSLAGIIKNLIKMYQIRFINELIKTFGNLT